MADRAPGEGRYAHDERERRFLLRSVPPHLSPGTRITDRYLDGTTLRLRRVEGPDGVVDKLTQKVRPDPGDPRVVRITNLYLPPGEHEVLRALPGHELVKVRHRWEVAGRTFAVDAFAGPLEGLVLAEVEVDGDDEVLAPVGAVADVSADDRFSGGALASAGDDFVAMVVRPMLAG